MTRPSPLELARLSPDEAAELGDLLDQLAPGWRRPGAQRWELGEGRAIELVRQLAATGARQARIGSGGGAAKVPAHESAVPFVDSATDLLEQLHGLLAAWAARTMREDQADAPVGPRRAAPRTLGTDDLAAWLLGRLHTLEHRPGVTREHLDRLRPLVRRARAVIDRPHDRWFAGPCATPLRDDAGDLVIEHGEQAYCEAELWAKPGAPVVVCVACGAHHRLETRRAELLRLARDRELRAVDVSRALTSLGMPCTPDRIRKWKQRHRLGVASLDDDGLPLYRVGDVMDLLVADAHRSTRRRPARKDTAA